MTSTRRARAEMRALKRWVEVPARALAPMERVIVDTRDGRRDRLVPRDVVMAKYREAELIYDMTSEHYAVPENGVEPDWLKEFNRV